MRSLKNIQRLLIIVLIGFNVLIVSSPAYAASSDPIIRRYFGSEPAEVKYDDEGNTKPFTTEDFTAGKERFDNSCINCHAGGLNLPFPEISLSLEKLEAATPPRDSISSLVDYMRYPLSYDGSDTNYWCRQVPENWMPQPQAEQLAAYILRAGEVVPSWGVPQKSPFDY
ncbi:MAG: photosystem II cytochrome PsbV2 [Microcoleaceae cyanobacterium]